MPIDASIALGVRPPEIISPLETYGRVLSLKHLMQQGQLGEEQLRGAQMENQQRQIDMQDQQTLRDAWAQSDGDLKKVLTSVAGKVTPKTLVGLQAAIVANEEKQSITQKNRAESGHYDAETAKMHVEAVGNAASGLLNLPEEQRATAWPTVRGQLIQQGVIRPQDAPEMYPGEPWLVQQHNAAMTGLQQLDEHLKAQEEARKQAEFKATLPGKQAESAIKGVEAQQIGELGMTKEQKARADEAARHNQVTEKQGSQRVGLEATRVGLEKKKFDMTLGAGMDANGQPIAGPDGKPVANPLAAAIANYQVPPPSARSLASPVGQVLMKQILAANPDFDATQFPNRNKTRQAFTTGAQGQQINAMNTAIGHLDQLSEAMSAMKNNSFRPGNAVYNAIATEFGSAAATNFDTLKVALAGELASVLKRTGATDAEIRAVESTISSKNSPEQIQGYIRTNIPILGSKLSALNYQYHQAMGEKDPFSALSPDAKGVLEKHGFNAEHPTLGGGNGGALPKGDGKVIDKGTAEQFYKAAGGDPVKARKLATDAGWRLQ